jgi:hypothetical protein
METPGLTTVLNVMEIVRYAVTVLILVTALAATYAIIAFGYIASAIAVMLGPIFIPFFIVPTMEWMFWGWLRSFMQYAFYPVVANAYIFVFGKLLVRFIDAHPPPYGGSNMAVFFFPLLCLLLAFTLGILKIPSLVNSLFSGRSGESTIPF